MILKYQQYDIKGLWRSHNIILNRKVKCKNDITEIKSENQTFINKNDIVNITKNYFSSIGPELAKNISSNQHTSFRDYMNDSIWNSMFLFHTSENEIFNVVLNCKNKNSLDIYDISMTCFKINYSIHN
jgi:hypothetical protein